MGITKTSLGKLRPLWAVVVGASVLFFSASLQAILDLRPSLALPDLTNQSDEPGIPNPSVTPEPAKNASVALNEWSYGRSRLWLIIIRTIVGPTDWIFGKGPGFASVTGLEETGINHPHNEYLRFLVDTGVIGLTLLILLGLTVLIALFQMRSNIGERQFWTGISLVFLLASHSMVTNTLIPPHFWVPVAVFLGLSLRPRQEKSERFPNSRNALSSA